MSETSGTIFRFWEIWMIEKDENYGFFLSDRGGNIIPLELWEEMKNAINSLYANTTESDRQEYNDRINGKDEVPAARKTYKPSPKPGKVYLLRGEGTGWFKIGVTTSIESRIKQVNVNSPFLVKLVACYDANDTIESEREWHARFSEKRTHGEWFELDENDVFEFVARSQR